jgi:hypothetical protein
MLTDLPMVTLLAGFLYYMRRENLSILWALAALACLARETGVCVVIGYAAWLAWRRLYSKAAVMLSAAVPLMLWIAYVDFYTSPGASFWTSYVGPARDLIAAFVRVRDYPVSALIQAIIRILDIIALLGFLLGFGRGVLLARRGGRLAFIIVPFLAVAALLTSMNDQFTDVYGYGRLFSPVLLVLLWDALASKRWLDIAPAAMILSRTVAIPVHETLTALSRVRL